MVRAVSMLSKYWLTFIFNLEQIKNLITETIIGVFSKYVLECFVRGIFCLFRYLILDNGTLILKQVQKDDQGEYR